MVQPICLPTRPRQFEEECCHVAGWGKTAANQALEDLPEILQIGLSIFVTFYKLVFNSDCPDRALLTQDDKLSLSL